MADSNVELLKQAFTAIQKKNDKEKVDNSINVKPAKVIGIDEDTHKVFTYFIDDTEQNAYTFYNKSGEVLSEGDTVRVYYTTNPAKGWIGARCGEPNIKEFENAGNDISHLFEYKYLTDLSVKFNDITYTVEKDSATGLISRISDDAGNEFEPAINSGITDVALHNAVFWAVAMCRGLSAPKIMPIRSGLVGYFDYKQRCRSSLWENLLGTENIPITGSAAVSADCLEMPNQTYGIFKMPYQGNGDYVAYMIAKTSEITATAAHAMVLASLYSDSYGNMRTFTASGYVVDGDQYKCWLIDAYGIGVSGAINGVYTRSDDAYHILTMVQESNVVSLYIDGVKTDNSLTLNYRYGDYWGLNCIANNTGNATTFSGVTSFIKMFAIGRTPHTAKQIATNVAWLKKYYEF